MIDGIEVDAKAGATIRSAAETVGIEIPTLCWARNLNPANACRLCVVEVEGTRPLVASCSRTVEDQMVITTNSARVRENRRSVLELLASAVELDWAESELVAHFVEYEARSDHFDGTKLEEASKIHDDLFAREYSRCVLCYRCVDACGDQAQHTFAIAIAGRGFESRVSTEFDVRLPDSACVYCGNCIAVCPTGALTPLTEFVMRTESTWVQERQVVTHTVCAFCGVGCNLELHVQDDNIVKVTSPSDHDISLGNLCIKGRFGWQHLD